MLKIKKVIDSFAALCSPLSNDDYVEVTVDGLKEYYSAFITMAMSHVEPFTVSELEALLVAQEDVLERFKKIELGTIQENVAQGAVQEPKDEMQPSGRGNGGCRAKGEVVHVVMVCNLNINYVEKLVTQYGNATIYLTKLFRIPSKLLSIHLLLP